MNGLNNVLTASRLTGMVSCFRRSFWNSEIGLRSTAPVHGALRFGTAWHLAMEARWTGCAYDAALKHALPEGVEMDEFECAKLAGLLAGYYHYYGQIEDVGHLHSEVQFQYPMEGMPFTLEGKIDGLGTMDDGQPVIMEFKTTGQSISPDADYWLRLAFNVQVYQYVDAARHLGWDIRKVFYDVTRKPLLERKEVFDLDDYGRKIIVDVNGKRIYRTKKVKTKVPVRTSTRKGAKITFKAVTKEVDDLERPRLSPDEKAGMFVKSHAETPDEYCERIFEDCKLRPQFYFARREIAVIDDQIESFRRHRIALANLILHMRESEEAKPRDPEAWPRHVDHDTCFFCDYKNFCLQNISVDFKNPPNGYAIKQFNEELQKP